MMILALRWQYNTFYCVKFISPPPDQNCKIYISFHISIYQKSGFSLAFGCLSLRETPKNSKWENQSNNRIIIVFEMQEKFNFLMEIFNIHILCRKILFLNYWQLAFPARPTEMARGRLAERRSMDFALKNVNGIAKIACNFRKNLVARPLPPRGHPEARPFP